MSIRILVDLNLSPDWIPLLRRNGWDAVHWSTIGDAREKDNVIVRWAVEQGYVIFTHDLDFGTALALTHANGPSILQVRGQDVMPNHMGPLVIAALRQHDTDLAAGALVVVEEARSRVRILPL